MKPIVERLNVTLLLDPYFGLKALATYSGMSVRTLRSHLDAQPDVALPCYRVNGRVLVRRSEFDEWMSQFRSRGRPSLAAALRLLEQKSPTPKGRHLAHLSSDPRPP